MQLEVQPRRFFWRRSH